MTANSRRDPVFRAASGHGFTGDDAPPVNSCLLYTSKLLVPAVSSTGIEVISSNMLLEHESDPVIWRGPVIAGAVKQFWNETYWKDIDYMLSLIHI